MCIAQCDEFVDLAIAQDHGRVVDDPLQLRARSNDLIAPLHSCLTMSCIAETFRPSLTRTLSFSAMGATVGYHRFEVCRCEPEAELGPVLPHLRDERARPARPPRDSWV